jgi:Zn-dependent peptidase ImmA (M78 family)
MMSYNHLTKRCTVFVNTEDYKYTQDFTIFHELAHLIRCLVNPAKNVYGFSVGEMYSKPGEERFCDRFAAAALMPARIFSQVWSANGEDADLKKARMTKLFGASGPAVMNRVTDLGLK